MKALLKMIWLIMLLHIPLSLGQLDERLQFLINIGKCPEYPAMPNFSTSEFQGVWHIAPLNGAKYSPCFTFNFTALSDNLMKIKISIAAGKKTRITYDAESFAPNRTNTAVMNWTWLSRLQVFDRVTVLDTDYKTYATMIVCNDYGLIHNKYVVLMSRTTDLSDEYYKKAQKVLAPFYNLQTDNRQPGCPFEYQPDEDGVFTLDYDEGVSTLTEILNTFI